jgi:branched-chain amino acid transport system substrate-binding protein
MTDGKQWQKVDRRAFTKALAAGGAVGLAGCSGQPPSDGDGSDGGGGDGGDGSDGGDGDGPGYVAMVNPLSGGAAVGGENMEKGMQLRFQELEESDGIDGTIPETLSENDECSAETAVSITQDLVSSHSNLSAYLGGYCSPTTLSTMQTTRQEEITQIVSSAAPAVTEEGHPYMFRIFPKTTQTAAMCVDYALNEIGAERIAVLGINNAWGTAITDNWRTLVEQSDQAELVDFHRVSQSTQDYSNQLNSIRSSDPDLIYALGYHGQTRNMLRQIEDMGMTIGEDVDVFIASIAGAILNDIAGEDTLANVYAPLLFQGPAFADYPDATPDYMVDFVEKWNENYDSTAIRESANGYAIAEALVQGMQAAGTTSDGAAIAEALHGLDEPFDTPFGPIEFDSSGQAELELFVAQYNENGQLERRTEPSVPDTSVFD